MGIKYVEVSEILFCEWFTTGSEFKTLKITNGIPENCEIVNINFYPSSRRVRVDFKHESFTNEKLEQIDVTIETILTED